MESFVARQPIFDRHLKVYAYELLFRSGLDRAYDALNGDRATSNVITTSFFLIGLKELTNEKRAFINFTRSLLVEEVAALFPNDLMSIEILESVEPDEIVIAACKNLKQAGYLIILDDFTYEDKTNPLIKLADIIKVDFVRTESEKRELIIREIDSPRVKFLAEKVETVEEFNQAFNAGYSYFQGYFFCKPVICSGKDIPGYKLNCLRVLHEVNKPEIEFDEIEDIIKQDVSLSYKLLKFINSAYFGFPAEIRSVKNALVLLGLNEVKKWVSLIALSSMAKDKPEELIVNSIIRAKLCEELAGKIGLTDRSPELYLMGLFSLIDAIIDKPMSEIIAELPLSEEVKIALVGGKCPFRNVYDIVESYEKGEWERFSNCASEFNFIETEFPMLFTNSVKWANKVLQYESLVH